MRLSEYLATTGTSREKFAELIGVSRQSVQNLVFGRFQPRLELALLIERVTNGAVAAESWGEVKKKRLSKAPKPDRGARR